jgi:hypothetical protein
VHGRIHLLGARFNLLRDDFPRCGIVDGDPSDADSQRFPIDDHVLADRRKLRTL